MDWSWLFVLACPLMMLPMMFMMMKGNHSDSDQSGNHKASNELNVLKEENNLLREELRQLKTKE